MRNAQEMNDMTQSLLNRPQNLVSGGISFIQSLGAGRQRSKTVTAVDSNSKPKHNGNSNSNGNVNTAPSPNSHSKPSPSSPTSNSTSTVTKKSRLEELDDEDDDLYNEDELNNITSKSSTSRLDQNIDEASMVEAELNDYLGLRLMRANAEAWIKEPFFDEVVKGSFVRVVIGEEKGVTVYRMAEVEQSSGGAYLPIAIKARSEEVLFVQLDSRISVDSLQEVLDMAIDGCRKVRGLLETAIKAHMTEQCAIGSVSSS
eukprot:gene36887-48115_t